VEEHFLDLCRQLGQSTPNEAGPTGDIYAFEKGAAATVGGDGVGRLLAAQRAWG
jgi:hypothetical protein